MIMLVARPPLYPLPMSTIQRPARRLSARILEKDDVTLQTSHAQTGGKVKTTASTSNTTATQDAKANERKRKMGRSAQYALLKIRITWADIGVPSLRRGGRWIPIQARQEEARLGGSKEGRKRSARTSQRVGFAAPSEWRGRCAHQG